MSSSESESEPVLSPRAIANKRNAARSTGPRTPGGKSRSSRNACKHNLTSEATILPGEDPQAYEDRLEKWLDHYDPAGPAEELLVERAVRASWMLDRCTLAEDAALATRIRHAADDFQLAAREEAEALGKRLIDDETNYCAYVDNRSQTATDLKEERRRNDPPLLALRLNSFAAGADWLLARWNELDATLDRIGHWHYSEAFRAIRLLGKRPDDLFDDAIVRLITLAANAADPREPSLVVDVQRLFGQSHNKPDSFERIKDLTTESPTAENGLAMLRHVVASEIGRLETQKSIRLDPLARLDIKCATAQAAFDNTDTGALRHRYEASRERALHRALADLARLAKAAPVEEPAPAPDVSPTPDQETTSAMGSFRQDDPADLRPTAPNPPADPRLQPDTPPTDQPSSCQTPASNNVMSEADWMARHAARATPARQGVSAHQKHGLGFA